MRIRDATAAEAPVLEALQRRSSDVWDQYREQLATHPEAIEVPQSLIDSGWVRVAVEDDDRAIGFSVVIPAGSGACELDGLFVEPDRMHSGVGRALVEDAVARASANGAACLEVTAGPAQGFYEKVGFVVTGRAETRFGPAVRMRRETLGGDPAWPPPEDARREAVAAMLARLGFIAGEIAHQENAAVEILAALLPAHADLSICLSCHEFESSGPYRFTTSRGVFKRPTTPRVRSMRSARGSSRRRRHKALRHCSTPKRNQPAQPA